MAFSRPVAHQCLYLLSGHGERGGGDIAGVLQSAVRTKACIRIA
jgi:hypothetical protein